MKRMLNKYGSHLVVLFIAVFFVTNGLVAQTDGKDQLADTKAQKIEWLTFEEAFEMHKVTPKPWVVDISTTWCGWCKRLDQTTFVDSAVVAEVNSSYYAVKLDGEHKEDITLNEQTYKFVESGRRGYHELAAALMNGEMSYPTIVFLSDQLQNLQPVKGFKSAQDFHPIVAFFSVFDSDNPTTWEDFMASYKSPYN